MTHSFLSHAILFLAISTSFLPAAMMLVQGSRLLTRPVLAHRLQSRRTLLGLFEREANRGQKRPPPRPKANPWVEWPVRIVTYGFFSSLAYFGLKRYWKRQERLASCEEIEPDKNMLVGLRYD